MKLYPDYYLDFVLQSGNKEKNLNQTQIVALTLLQDVLDRRGFRQEFDNFAKAIKNEVISDWIQIIEDTDNARVIVQKVMLDMRERSGWDFVFDDIDAETLGEMEETLLSKIVKVIAPRHID